MQYSEPQQVDVTPAPPADATPERVDLVTRVRQAAPAPGKLARTLTAAGVRLVASRAGGSYGDCPACGSFAGLALDADGAHWRSSCGCFGRFALGEPEAAALLHRAGHAS
jgi:hypothetical protein